MTVLTPFHWNPLLEDTFRSTGFLRDAKAVNALSDAAFDEALAIVAGLRGFPEQAEVADSLRGAVGDAADSVARFVQNFSHFRAMGDGDHESFARELERRVRLALGRRKPPVADADMPAEDVTKTVARVRACSGPFEAVDRAVKARVLSGKTGSDLQELSILCDLRPVFDPARETVDGFLTLTLLRIVHTNAEGLPRAVEVRLSEAELASLCEEALNAKRKLAVLREYAGSKGIDLAFQKATT